MASKTAILAVRIISDGKAAAKGFKDAEDATRAYESALNTSAAAAAGAVAAIGAISWVAVNAASDLQQSAGAVSAVFGTYADELGALADDSAKRVGLAQEDYQQLAATLGAQLKNLGIEEENLVGQTDELITMGADLAAVFNGSTSEAVSALSALMRGERDPIERYGVTIKQAAVNARMAEMGLDDLEGSAKTAAEAQVTLALLSEQTGHAIGMFAGEADTAAVSTQVAKSMWQDAAAALGESLLPFVVTGAEMLTGLAETFQENSDTLIPLLATIGVFVGIIAALVLGLKAYETAVAIATAAQTLWNLAMAANPIGLIITIIVVLIGFIIMIATNWEDVKQIWGDAVGAMIGWIEDLINWVIDAINWVAKLFGAAGDLGHVDWGLEEPAAARAVSAAAAAPETAAFARTFAAPQTFAPARTGSQLVAAGRSSTSSQETAQPINITVNGALDPESVARQIRDLLVKQGKQTGTIPTGGQRWNPNTRR